MGQRPKIFIKKSILEEINKIKEKRDLIKRI